MRPRAAQKGRRADGAAAPAGELLQQECDEVFGRRSAARRAGPRLAYDPEILFFDEPLSAIDYKLRKTLEKELKDIHRETGKTFVYITHSLEEAMVMSDRIGVMRAGRLVQVGTPDDIYMRPQSTSSSPNSWARRTPLPCAAKARAFTKAPTSKERSRWRASRKPKAAI
jgi:ABC-type multidrug transport system ATPase subunit